HGGFLELRRVHLVRYLEHFFFPSFRSSLYATCWKAKFQGKLSMALDSIQYALSFTACFKEWM
ncbi:hypothetical protein V3398_31435, partial [Pseudomonas aeruginosa]|uniref:hypothetical protein n=1 Tax=Pseudomonas aeruginosa TaxID=287 RepID=UPI002F4053F9